MNGVARRILVPVDFERGSSRRALRYARALASMSKGEICLLHIVPAPAGEEVRGERWWIDLAERTLSGLAGRARLPPGTETRVLTGPIAPLIGKYACEHKFDLVILSGRSQPDWHGSYLGSTAAAIVRHCRVPILIIPAAVAKQATREEEHPAAASVRAH